MRPPPRLLPPRHMFNPFKYQYTATYLRTENEDAVLRLQHGTIDKEIRIPISLLPSGMSLDNVFVLSLQAKETAKKGEYESLKELLEELIQ